MNDSRKRARRCQCGIPLEDHKTSSIVDDLSVCVERLKLADDRLHAQRASAGSISLCVSPNLAMRVRWSGEPRYKRSCAFTALSKSLFLLLKENAPNGVVCCMSFVPGLCSTASRTERPIRSASMRLPKAVLAYASIFPDRTASIASA